MPLLADIGLLGSNWERRQNGCGAKVRITFARRDFHAGCTLESFNSRRDRQVGKGTEKLERCTTGRSRCYGDRLVPEIISDAVRVYHRFWLTSETWNIFSPHAGSSSPMKRFQLLKSSVLATLGI